MQDGSSPDREIRLKLKGVYKGSVLGRLSCSREVEEGAVHRVPAATFVWRGVVVVDAEQREPAEARLLEDGLAHIDDILGGGKALQGSFKLLLDEPTI